MVNSANKTRKDVVNNIPQLHSAWVDIRNGTHVHYPPDGQECEETELDKVIKELRARVASNVKQVLEDEKKRAESLQVQTQPIYTADPEAPDQGSAVHNKTLQSNVNQAVLDVIGGREHEAIRGGFQKDDDYPIQQDSTRHPDPAVNATLQRLKNIL